MTSRFICMLIAGLIAVGPGAAPATAQPDARLSAVRALLEPWNAPDRPGAIVSVMIDGAVVASVAAGSADLEQRLPITARSVFHAASLSKQVTAFAILLLEQDGRLSIDDPLARHIPEAAPLGPITLRQLLTHTSGLREHLALLAAAGWRSEDLTTDRQALRMLFAQRGANFAPGTAYQYINSDYVLLAEIVRRISGKTLDGFCQERIFGPIGMAHSRFQESVATLIPDRVQSYRHVGGGYARAILTNEIAGPSNLTTTAEDLNRWARNLETGAIGGPRVIARMAERGVLADGTVNSYALGQDIYRYHGFDAWMHGGRDAGYRSFLLRVPSERLSVAVLGNVDDLNSGLLATAAADIYLAGRPGWRDAPAKAARAPRPAQLAAYAGSYELFPGLIFSLSTDGRQLRLEPLGSGKPATLTALSPTSFAIDREGWTRLEFAPPAKGGVSGFIYRIGYDGFIPARRVAIAPFDAETVRLQDYVGRYHSTELETDYRLLIENGTLVARHPRRADIPLRPYQPERFSSPEWFFQDLEFTRDARGGVTGFRLSGVNAEAMTFERVDRPD